MGNDGLVVPVTGRAEREPAIRGDVGQRPNRGRSSSNQPPSSGHPRVTMMEVFIVGPMELLGRSRMGTEHRTSRRTMARLAWGGLAVVLAGALVATLSLSGKAVDGAEIDAEARAVDWASTVLSAETEPAQLGAPILGPEFGDLLLAVQSGILADERAVRVRLWSSEGVLVFSSDQRDRVGDARVTDSPEIETALHGETISLPTQPLAAPRSGLAGADEELFRTFVPLPVGSQVAAGVAEIDQRYGMIETERQGPWRVAQVGLGVLVLGSLGMLVRPARRTLDEPLPSLDQPAREEEAPPSRREARAAKAAVAKAEEETRAALERAEHAEAAVEASQAVVEESKARVRELEERLAQAQEQASAAESAVRAAALPVADGSSGRGVPRIGALVAEEGSSSSVATMENDLRETELEHDRLSDEVDRLRETLAERDAELALAREASGAADDEDGVVRERLAEAEAKAASAELRAADLEEQLRESQARASQEEETARAKLAETESALERTLADLAAAAQDTAAPSDGDPAVPSGEESELRARIEQLEAERRADVTELQRAQEALANTQYEATAARNRVKELEQQLLSASVDAPSDAAEEVPGSDPGPSSDAVEGRSEPFPVEPPADEPPGGKPPGENALDDEPPAGQEPVSEEGMSLRERLVQAAAARHRSARMTPSDDE